MKVYLISYSTPNFRISQIMLGITAFIFGCHKIVSKKKIDLIKTDFFLKNKNILIQSKGGGYWLWKYYFIAELIKKIEKNDIIIYSDSGIIFRKSIKPILELLLTKTKGVLLFYNAYKNKEWTKRDCFIKLNCETEEYYNSPLVFGGLQLFQKNEFSVKFIDDVLNYSCQDNIITDSPNIFGKPNFNEFIENRHDQSVTSLIAHKNNIPLYPDPSQFRSKNILYQFPNEYPLNEILYKNIIYVHRLAGFSIFTLPFKLLNELFFKLRLKLNG